MSRPLRIQFEGAWYHVMNRGAGRRRVFHDDDSRLAFLNLLDEIYRRYRVEVHAYCLMGNHYHLYLRTPLANLSRAMRHLDGVYTQRYNRAYETDGPLFRGRYKSILVDDHAYHLRLSRYIHLNPIEAKMVEAPEQYPWSSYSNYLQPVSAPDWLRTDATLSRFGDTNQIEKYRMFVGEGVDEETESFFKKLRRLPILGTEAFVKTITEKYLSDGEISKEIVDVHRVNKRPDIGVVINIVCDYFKGKPSKITRMEPN